MASSGSTRSAAPARMASFGIPKTTQLASSCAMVRFDQADDVRVAGEVRERVVGDRLLLGELLDSGLVQGDQRRDELAAVTDDHGL